VTATAGATPPSTESTADPFARVSLALAQAELTPTPTEEGGPEDAGTDEAQAPDNKEIPPLEDIFDISGINDFQLLLAAVFGLAPETLLNVLRQRGEVLKQDLKASEASGGE
jgi:hypothetical protein